MEAIHDCPISNHLAGASLNSKQQSCRDLSSKYLVTTLKAWSFRQGGTRCLQRVEYACGFAAKYTCAFGGPIAIVSPRRADPPWRRDVPTPNHLSLPTDHPGIRVSAAEWDEAVAS